MRARYGSASALVAILLAGVYLVRAASGLVGGVSYSLGNLAASEGDFPTALRHLQRGVVGFDRFDALLLRADARIFVYDKETMKPGTARAATGVLAAAATDYLEAASLCPPSGLPWAGLGQVYLRAERAASETRPVSGEDDSGWRDVGRPGRVSIGMLRLAERRNPQVYGFGDQLVLVFLELGLRDSAIDAVRAAARSQPYFMAHGWDLYRFPRDLLAAFAEEARGALGHAPMLTRGQHLLSLGRVELRLGDLGAATAHLEEAVAIPRELIYHAEYAYYLAVVHVEAGRFRDAEKALEIAELYPSLRVSSLELRATIAEKEQRWSDAARFLNDARRLAPEYLGLCLRFADDARKTKDWAAALESLRWAIVKHPADPAPRIALVETLVEIGEAGEAERQIQDLERLTGTTPDVQRLRQLTERSPVTAP
jgi:tetratricopeptide (TPR) repeat protein